MQTRRHRATALEDVDPRTRRDRLAVIQMHLNNLGGGADALESNVAIALADYPGCLARAVKENPLALTAVLKELLEREGVVQALYLFSGVVFQFVTRERFQGVLVPLGRYVESELGINPLLLSAGKAKAAAKFALPTPPVFDVITRSRTCIGIVCSVEKYINWLLMFPSVRKRLLTGTMNILAHTFTDAAQWMGNRKVTCVSVRVLCLDGLPKDSAFYDGIVAMYGGGDDRSEQKEHLQNTVYKELQDLMLVGIDLNGVNYGFEATFAQDGLSWRACGGKGAASSAFASSMWRIHVARAAASVNDFLDLKEFNLMDGFYQEGAFKRIKGRGVTRG